MFDLGIGDIFSVRVAGNVLGENTLGSIEYGVIVSGVKLVLVMGHTRCGAVTAAVNLLCTNQDVSDATGCQHLESIVTAIGESLDHSACPPPNARTADEQTEALIVDVTRRNILHTVNAVTARSDAIRTAVAEGRALVVGALYDVTSGKIEFVTE